MINYTSRFLRAANVPNSRQVALPSSHISPSQCGPLPSPIQQQLSNIEKSFAQRGACASAAVVDKSATRSTASTQQLRTDLEQLFLYDTLDRKRKPFVPDEGRPVSMYVCGVTSYDYSHVGHARVYVAFDVLVRVLQHIGREVNYVRNFTDIDDKIIARAQQVGEDPLALSGRFIDEFHRDMDVLGCMRPDHEPKATDYIASMISSIESIVENGHAYSLENGDVYFDVQSLSSYGRLSRQSLDQNVAGGSNRVAADSRKRHPADFALWKAAKEGEPYWESPWGRGRPGWHIECSSMIESILGPVIDIHGGGQDLIFPHHENELAQSQAACCPGSETCSDQSRLARFWLHNGFVNINNEKMSKSVGNFFTIRDVLKKYHGMAMRWFLLGTQYRQPINYSQVALEEASARLYYVTETLLSAKNMIKASEEGEAMEQAEAELSRGEGFTAEAWSDFQAALLDDLNTPAAIAHLSEPLKTMNELLVVRKKKPVENRTQKLAAYVALVEKSMALLGIRVQQPEQTLQELRALALERAELTEEEILQAIADRAAARANKNYAAADELREKFVQKGINFQDSPDGTTWRPSTQEC